MTLKNRKNGRKRRLWLRFWIIFLLPVCVFFWAERNLRPVILSMAEAQARVMAVQAMNDAVFEVMRSGGGYEELIRVMLDDSGRVSMIQADTARMNELSTQAALTVQRNLDAIADTGISVPLGAALNSKLFSGSGPDIIVQMVPVGAVSTDFVSEFTSAGINQTLHKIFLRMEATVTMIIPTGAQSAHVTAKVPVAESIIVGSVPDSFVDVEDEQELLDVVQ